MSAAGAEFRHARDFLLQYREDYDAAHAGFTWPRPAEFNWALEHFDVVASSPVSGERIALWLVMPDGSEAQWSYAEMSQRSNQVARWLQEQGVERGDRLILMLDNQVELWDSFLAAMKLGAVIVPATPQLGAADLADRIERGGVRHVVARSADHGKFSEVAGDYTRIAVGEPVRGWRHFGEAFDLPGHRFVPELPTRADEPVLLYFTSGTTAKPKLVGHTHASYPIGHLSTMYWIGLRPGDIHLNISSPGWAKHAWSNIFAPWSAEATVLVVNFAQFEAGRLLEVLVRTGVTTFCAPPTVWRMLLQADLRSANPPVRELVSAGEPLNPEVIEQVRQAWGLTIRDGFGQTETTAQVANPPGQPVKSGSMGRPLPGCPVVLVDPETGEFGDEGEISVDRSAEPVGLMAGYADQGDASPAAVTAELYRTGDIGSRDPDGYITYVGRADDVFKASDYRISPFELESVLIQHEAVLEAAVVPAPDAVRLHIPKAYVALADGWTPSRETAFSILRYARQQLPGYKRIRRLEFADLPKTISGKIRRVALRQRELDRGESAAGDWPDGEYRDEELPEVGRR